jgi:hypothetical protein
MDTKVCGTLHFVDGTSLKLAWERKEDDPTEIITKVRKAIEKDRFIFEVDGDLILIPVQNIKYFRLTPVPKALPKDLVIRGASIIE